MCVTIIIINQIIINYVPFNFTGADVTKYDGVYSRFFTEFTGDGYYGIKITVVNNGSAIILGERPISRAIPNLPLDEGENPPTIGRCNVYYKYILYS